MRTPALTLTILCGAIALSAQTRGTDWPSWRGLNGGVSSDRILPTRWTATENVAWRAPLAGAGVSTPIVSGDRIYVTSQIGAGVRREGNHPLHLSAAEGTFISSAKTARPSW
jgi:hypothetical protein